MKLITPDKANILVPGRGYVNVAAMAVAKAVEGYDERLMFGKHQETEQWVVFLKMPADFDGMTIGTQKVLPLFGWDEIPSPDEALKKLWETDSYRQGNKILDDIEKHNAKIKKVYEDAASDATGQMAEGVEWARRKLGAHPNPRIFVPGKGD